METKKKNQLTRLGIRVWLWKHDRKQNPWACSHQNLSVLYNGNLTPQSRLLYFHLKTLGKQIFSSNKDLAHGLNVSEGEVQDALSQLLNHKLIEVKIEGFDRIIHVSPWFPACTLEQMIKYLNVTRNRVLQLVENGLFTDGTDTSYNTLTLLNIKRFDIVHRERGRKNLHQFFNKKVLLQE